jgi:hypothetical protein
MRALPVMTVNDDSVFCTRVQTVVRNLAAVPAFPR